MSKRVVVLSQEVLLKGIFGVDAGHRNEDVNIIIMDRLTKTCGCSG